MKIYWNKMDFLVAFNLLEFISFPYNLSPEATNYERWILKVASDKMNSNKLLSDISWAKLNYWLT